MNLVKIEMNDKHEPVVYGRTLHEALGVKTPYSMWFERMVDYGFVENTDYILLNNFVKQNGSGGHNKLDHILSLDMAKEIAMIQRTEKGKEVRQYFIQVEKEYNSPEKIMQRALLIANENINKLEIKVEEMKPKALFADSVSASHTSILVGDLAKLIKQNGVEIGQKRLFEWLRYKGYLIKRHGSDWNMPTQRAMEQGLFEIKESTHASANGSVRITRTPKVTGKGQVFFVNKFLGGAGNGNNHNKADNHNRTRRQSAGR